jgi:HTH-type transcriptional regulator/antitoxin HigA
VGHVLKHRSRAIYLDDAADGGTAESPEEQEANRFATDTLVPRAAQARLASLPLDADTITGFAAEIGVHPGIVVGQLQHRGRIGWADAVAKLKARMEFANHAAATDTPP